MKTLVVAGLVLAGGLAGCRQGSYRETYAADNSGKNARDRFEGAVTVGDQSKSTADLGITRSIREAIRADNSLSMNANNVKVASSDGVVTLRGPVASASEKAAVAATAQRVAGVRRVENELEVASN
jgi:hyperosmotically inducible protein